MKVNFVSYATHDAMGFYKNQDKLCRDVKNFGHIDNVIKLRGNDIGMFRFELADYIKKVDPPKYPRIHRAKYYIWKSYIILDTLNKIDDGDVIVYHDVGRDCYPFKITCDLKWFAEYVIKNHKGLYVNFGPFCNRRFTKRECFKVMNCDTEYYHESRQANGSWGVYQKNDLTLKFVKEWFDYCMHPSMIVTDIEKDTDKLPGYEAHRHDQSILTNMLLKYKKEHGLPLDPKLDGKLPRPWGWEKDMCLAISRIKEHLT